MLDVDLEVKLRPSFSSIDVVSSTGLQEVEEDGGSDPISSDKHLLAGGKVPGTCLLLSERLNSSTVVC